MNHPYDEHATHEIKRYIQQVTGKESILERPHIQFVGRTKGNAVVLANKRIRTRTLMVSLALCLMFAGGSVGAWFGLAAYSTSVQSIAMYALAALSAVTLCVALWAMVRKGFDQREAQSAQAVNDCLNVEAKVTLVPGTASEPTHEAHFKDEDHRGVPHQLGWHALGFFALSAAFTGAAVGTWYLCQMFHISAMLSPVFIAIPSVIVGFTHDLGSMLNFALPWGKNGLPRFYLNWVTMVTGMSKAETDQDVYQIEKARILAHFNQENPEPKAHAVVFNSTMGSHRHPYAGYGDLAEGEVNRTEGAQYTLTMSGYSRGGVSAMDVCTKLAEDEAIKPLLENGSLVIHLRLFESVAGPTRQDHFECIGASTVRIVVEDVDPNRPLNHCFGRTLPCLDVIKVESIGPYTNKSFVKDHFDQCWSFKQVNGESSGVNVAMYKKDEAYRAHPDQQYFIPTQPHMVLDATRQTQIEQAQVIRNYWQASAPVPSVQ